MILFPKAKGTCLDAGLPGFDDQPGCGARLGYVQYHRTAVPCRRDCLEMAFASCAVQETFSDCICIDGTTKQEGYKINGCYVGWNAPVGLTPTQVAVTTSPGNPHAYYSLFGCRPDTDLNCPINLDDWDPLMMDGEYVRVDLEAVPLVTVDGACVGGAYFLTNEQLLIVDDVTEPATGSNCKQTGGRRALAMEITDGNGKRLMLCVFAGPVPPPQCDLHQCCDWHITGTSETGCTEGSSLPGVIVERPESCEFKPDASVIFTVDGVDTPYPIDPDVAMAFIQHPVACPTISGTVTARLVQDYPDEAPCPDPADETHDFTL